MCVWGGGICLEMGFFFVGCVGFFLWVVVFCLLLFSGVRVLRCFVSSVGILCQDETNKKMTLFCGFCCSFINR